MTEPAIITLEDPIENEAGETITEIELRPPTLKDRQLLDKWGLRVDPKTQQVHVDSWATTAFNAAQRLGNLSPATAEKIGTADASKIFSAVMVFIGGSQMNGQMPSQS